MKESTYAILGLGRFGCKLTTVLSATGAPILIADSDQDKVNQYADRAMEAVCLDLCNASAIEEIGLDHVDIAVVDQIRDLQASIMAVMVSKEQGVERVIATASTSRFGEILQRVGADEIIIPADEAAARMAQRLLSEDFVEFHDLGGDACVIKVKVPKRWVRKSLRQLQLLEKEHIRVVGIEENGEMNIDFRADTVFGEDAVVSMVTHKGNVYNFVD